MDLSQVMAGANTYNADAETYKVWVLSEPCGGLQAEYALLMKLYIKRWLSNHMSGQLRNFQDL